MGIGRFSKKLTLLVIFVGCLVLFYTLGGDRYLSFEAIKANRGRLMQYTEQNYWPMVIGAGVTYTAITALSIPLASGLSLTIGFLFGRWVGTILILISATLGATLVFLGTRYVFADAVQRRLGKLIPKIMEGFSKNDFSYLLFLRLIPLFPFWLVNLVAAFTPTKARTYIMATAIGILPGCFVFSNLGQSLAEIESPEGLFSFQTFVALVLLGIFALLPVLIKKNLIPRKKEVF